MKTFIILAAVILLAGCGVYSFSSSSLGGVKTIAIPQFENSSLEYGIQDEITSQVIEKFIADNSLKVTAQKDADAVLRGEIVKYERVPYTYDKSDNVSEYKVNIIVNFVVEKRGGKALLERNNLLGFGVYNSSTGTEDDGKRLAIDKLAKDIVDETTKTW